MTIVKYENILEVAKVEIEKPKTTSMNKYYKKLIELEGGNEVEWDISHRGGNYGVRAKTALELVGWLGEYDHYLPRNFGAYVNYLGGGLRGSICKSDFNKDTPTKYAKELNKLADACARRYKEIEDSAGLNSETDQDGETNWEAMGTAMNRQAGVESAY